MATECHLYKFFHAVFNATRVAYRIANDSISGIDSPVLRKKLWGFDNELIAIEAFYLLSDSCQETTMLERIGGTVLAQIPVLTAEKV